MELKQEELDKVLAGNTQGMSYEEALNNFNLFREKQIEELKKEKNKKSTLNSISNLKEIVGGIKVVSVTAMILHSIIILAIIAMSVYSIIKFNEVGVEQSLNNEGIIEFVSSINDYDVLSAKEYLLEYKTSTGVILLEIIIPAIICIIGLTLYNLVCNIFIKIVKGVKDNKTLFTKEKFNLLIKVRALLIFAFVCGFFISDISLFLLIIFELLIEVVLYLFNYCVNGKN